MKKTTNVPNTNSEIQVSQDWQNEVPLNKTCPDTIAQNFSEMQKSFFNLSSTFEALEHNFKQVSQNFSTAKEHALNLAVSSEDLASNFPNYHLDMCML